jgi:hypothetical protein
MIGVELHDSAKGPAAVLTDRVLENMKDAGFRAFICDGQLASPPVHSTVEAAGSIVHLPRPLFDAERMVGDDAQWQQFHGGTERRRSTIVHELTHESSPLHRFGSGLARPVHGLGSGGTAAHGRR